MFALFIDAAKDACIDALKILPFLFAAYLLMEALEGHTDGKWPAFIARQRRLGPLFGALLGIVPQCGFSAAAANLYAGRLITAGTLLAVFLSTSDEMLPLLLSAGIPAGELAKILVTKALLALLFGFLIDCANRGRHRVLRIFPRSRIGAENAAGAGEAPRIHELCVREHCHCDVTAEDAAALTDSQDDARKKSARARLILRSALSHTLQIFLFVLLFTIAANILIALIGEERMSAVLYGNPVLSHFVAGLIGLIPNCAASVVITELYLRGLISAGTMFSGLLVGAGVGLLVLFRANPERGRNLRIALALYGCGVLGGLLVDLCGLF